jgi:putative ABC transport system substrate-binding protein
MLANTSSIDIQQDLATHAAAIRDLGKRTVEQVIEIGQRLTVCKKLVGHVIVGQTTPVIRALRQATSSIPIIMAAVNDPVEQGFVSSLAHPGGNITGFTFIDFEMVGKWLEMLKEAAPGVSRAVLMFNPDTSPHYYVYLRSFEAVPRSIAVEVTTAPVRDTADAEEAIAKLGREPGGGLIVPPDAFTIVLINC